jgi:PhzF family phenazine biosynthesis protein
MDTRDVLLADAFADEPTGGRPVAVLPDGDGLSDAQCRQVGSELGVASVVARRDGTVEYVDTNATGDAIEGALAGSAALAEREQITGTEWTVETDRGALRVEREDDGRTFVDRSSLVAGDEFTELAASSAVDESSIADALGIDVAALRDVGADLPLARADSAGGSILVPVNFFDHLSRADPDLSALSTLCATADARRLVVFTFDTLSGAADAHARVFAPAAGGELPTAATPLADCGVYLSRQGVFDGERSEITFECGHVLDRPGTVAVRPADPVQVGGRAVTTLDGTLTIPDSEDEEIIEV